MEPVFCMSVFFPAEDNLRIAGFLEGFPDCLSFAPFAGLARTSDFLFADAMENQLLIIFKSFKYILNTPIFKH